ncbi:MAG: tetratricopeptide repeat protein, partial [Bacteroidota bacterium]|nr:tetratricopeptide repeat protein [Bacteroidota bacterium]
MPNPALQYSFINIERQYAFTHDGFVAITAIFKNTLKKNIADSALYYTYLSNYYRHNDNDSLQLVYADRLLSIVNQPRFENAFHKQRAIGYINKARTLYYAKKLKDCYYYYYNGSVEADKANDASLTEDINSHLTMFLYEEGNYAKAIVGYKKGLKEVKGKNKTWQRLMANIGTFDNIGICFLKEKNADSAKQYLEEAVRLCEEAKPMDSNQIQDRLVNLGVVFGNLAQAYLMLNQKEKAEQIFQQSVAINSQPNYANENALITQQQLAELFYAQNKTSQFYNTLLRVKKGLDTLHTNSVAIRWNDMMSRYYASLHQPQKAWFYLNAYKQLADKNDGQKIISQLDVFDQMSLMQSRYNVSLLKKNNQIKT